MIVMFVLCALLTISPLWATTPSSQSIPELLSAAHILVNEKKHDLAIEQYVHILALDPSHERAYLDMGTAYEALKKYDYAIAAYQHAILHHPNSFQAYHRLGVLFNHLERLEDALEPYQKAVTLQPTNLNLIMEYANILSTLDKHEEAIFWYKKMLEINPNILSALYNIGYTLKKMGELHKALRLYDEIIAQKPDYAPVRFSRSGIYLTLGDFEHGWDEYEWRFKAYEEDPKKFNRPLWEGEDLTNNSLVVYAEQGLGDTLQFIRYIKHLKKTVRNVRITFESQEPLTALMKIQPYIDSVVPRTERPSFCYYQIPLMSIPRIIKTRMETIPCDIPYLEADPKLIAYWKQKLAPDTKLKVGICWNGNSHYSTPALRRAVASKSISLELLKPLAHMDGVSLYCLQRITGTDQLAACSFKDKLIIFDDDFDVKNGRFMDTAAVIKNLDLVISIDTGICHLAGALGIPTWILLPNPADWRWLTDRTDTPWYPAARLFKQPKPGDWQSVVHEITTELQSVITQKKIFSNKSIKKEKS